ncbi:hypothetical protein B0J18DRAFT_482753 [Chaetomium sp. MPI-SDFR-AT-0129]|nr:hypothetical protein B0J18DRAFT_482753 [Chaetomium sp. MPI-SDFR-AT-0129]
MYSDTRRLVGVLAFLTPARRRLCPAMYPRQAQPIPIWLPFRHSHRGLGLLGTLDQCSSHKQVLRPPPFAKSIHMWNPTTTLMKGEEGLQTCSPTSRAEPLHKEPTSLRRAPSLAPSVPVSKSECRALNQSRSLPFLAIALLYRRGFPLYTSTEAPRPCRGASLLTSVCFCTSCNGSIVPAPAISLATNTPEEVRPPLSTTSVGHQHARELGKPCRQCRQCHQLPAIFVFRLSPALKANVSDTGSSRLLRFALKISTLPCDHPPAAHRV